MPTFKSGRNGKKINDFCDEATYPTRAHGIIVIYIYIYIYMYVYIIQLSPEGEVNSGGYIPRREEVNSGGYISAALHRP